MGIIAIYPQAWYAVMLMKSTLKNRTLPKLHLDKVATTPDGFNFFVAIHDFVQQLELHVRFKTLTLPAKYSYLKQIHQGIEDLNLDSDRSEDLGHDRYMVIQDLLKIRNKDFSESNPLWKKREMLRRFSADIYIMLNPPPAESTNAVTVPHRR